METQDATPEGKWPSQIRKEWARGMEGRKQQAFPPYFFPVLWHSCFLLPHVCLHSSSADVQAWADSAALPCPLPSAVSMQQRPEPGLTISQLFLREIEAVFKLKSNKQNESLSVSLFLSLNNIFNLLNWPPLIFQLLQWAAVTGKLCQCEALSSDGSRQFRVIVALGHPSSLVRMTLSPCSMCGRSRTSLLCHQEETLPLMKLCPFRMEFSWLPPKQNIGLVGSHWKKKTHDINRVRISLQELSKIVR